MQFMKLSVLLFRFQMLLFHPVLWLPKVFGFPRLLVSNVMGFPKLLWFSKGVLGLRQRAFSDRFSFLIGFAFPVEIVRSCSLEESRHRSAKHWYGITLFRSFLWLLQRLFPESNHPVQHAPAKILEVPYLRRNGICKNRICFRIDILLSLLCGISLSYVHGSRPTAVLVVMDISNGYLSYIRELYMNLRCVSCSAGDRSILFCTARTTFSKF